MDAMETNTDIAGLANDAECNAVLQAALETLPAGGFTGLSGGAISCPTIAKKR